MLVLIVIGTVGMDKMSDEEAERERKNFNDNVRVESATFTKVMTYNVSKYVDV